MAESLRNPPLAEAIFELQLKPTAGWDWTVAGLLYERFKEQFSERGQAVAVAMPGLPVNIQPVMGFQRVQLKRSDGSAMIQIAPNQLVVNHLRPYPGWVSFKKLVLAVVEGFLASGPRLDPIGMHLRYVNLVGPLPRQGDLSAVLTVLPQLSGPLMRESAGFYQRHELIYDQPKGVLVLQAGLTVMEKGTQGVLDLDFVSATNGAGGVDTVEALSTWLEEAHENVGAAFRADRTIDSCLISSIIRCATFH